MRVSLLILVAFQAVSGQKGSSPEPEPNMGCPDGQHMCEDEYNSYCENDGTCCPDEEKCPVGSADECSEDGCYCNSTMVDCYIDIYNAAGEWLYANYSCVVNQDACPCADGYFKCKDEYGPWCQLEPCPCTGTEKTCHGYSYDSDGRPIDTPVTCVQDISACTCGAGALSTPCTEESGMLYECIPIGKSCPVVCNQTFQKYCEAYPFDANGFEDFDAEPNISCAPISTGCPCNNQWQVQCVDPTYGDTWCQSKDYSCPVSCKAPEEACSYHEYAADGSYVLDSSGHLTFIEKCRNLTSAGDCPCDPDHEIACVVGSGISEYTECYWKDSPEIIDGNCPVNCEAQGKVECWPQGFDANGDPTYGAMTSSGQFIGVCADNYDDDACVYDFTTGQICPGSETFVWKQTDCPKTCAANEEKCYVYLFSPGSSDYNGSVVEECRPIGDACCDLVNGKTCPEPDGPGYCLGASETCFLFCNATQRICTHEAFHANGSHIESSFSDESCQNTDVACSCGTGAELCNPNSPATAYCIPKTIDVGEPGAPDIQLNTCPANCNSKQEVCGTMDYDTKGNFLRYNERCVPKALYDSQGCTCGGNATQCRYGPNPSDFFCEPLWDKVNEKVFQCPKYCSGDKPVIHQVPNFDSNGDYIDGSIVEYCAAAGDKPDCARGQNAKSCVIDGITECIPTVGPGSFCPIPCPSNKVQCLPMDNFNSTTGEWVSSSAPPASQACQDKYEDCPCGAGARPCNGECRPTALSCPITCTTAAKPNICTVTHYTGLEPTGEIEYCISDNATCPCGNGATICSQKLGDIYEDVCYPTSQAAYVCPCKVGEKVCNVRNFLISGMEGEPSTVCVGANSPCPCGTHATTCKDGSCVAKYAKEGGCYQYCTVAEEAEGKSTCKRYNFDQTTGEPASSVVQCATSCTAGRGQKKCTSGAIIPVQNKCENIYGLNTASLTRRLAVASGESQTSSVSFTIENLKSPMATVASTKPKIDGILQIQPTLETELIRQVGTSEASLQYKVTNLGKSMVAPSAVVDALKKKLNTKSPDIVNALAGMGTVKLGSRGCCSSTTVSKVNVVVTTTPAMPEPAPEPAPESFTTSMAPTSSSSSAASPTPSPSPTSTSSSSSAASPTPSPSPTSTSTTPGATTSLINYHSTYSGDMTLLLDNCTAFVLDSVAREQVDVAIAGQIDGVEKEHVASSVVCTSRRLSEFEAAMRRLASNTATVSYTITLPATLSTAAHATALSHISAMTAANVQTTLSTGLAAAGLAAIYNVTVVQLGVATLDVSSSSSPTTSKADSIIEDDDGSVRSSLAWTTLMLLLAALYRK